MLRLLAAILLLSPFADAQKPMEKLAALFTGHWTIVDTFVASPGQPASTPRHGQELWHTLGGGAPLVEEYRSQGSDGAWEYDTAALWWDAAEQKYSGLFCADFLDHGCDAFEVNWPENPDKTKQLVVMSGSYTQKGKLYRWREDFDFSNNTAFTQTLYIAEEGKDLNPVASISARRTPATRP